MVLFWTIVGDEIKCLNCKTELGRPKPEEKTRADGRSSTVQLESKRDKYIKICPVCGRRNVMYLSDKGARAYRLLSKK